MSTTEQELDEMLEEPNLCYCPACKNVGIAPHGSQCWFCDVDLVFGDAFPDPLA